VIEVGLDRLPPGFVVGNTLTAYDPHGRPIHLEVVALDAATARLDGNHPLAGEAVTFVLTVLKVEGALKEELAALKGN